VIGVSRLTALAAALAAFTAGCLPVEDIAHEGDFTLRIAADRLAWSSAEEIKLAATLTYDGPLAETTLWGSGDGVVFFSVIEIGGTRRLEASWHSDCGPHPIGPAEPIHVPYRKSGGFSADDPNAAFYRAFFADPLFHLPPGRWEVLAQANFATGDGCGGNPINLVASLVLTVA